MTPCPTRSSRTGNSRARKAISATASAVIPSSSPADNPDFKTSLSFAELIGKEMKAQGLHYARQYTQAIMGRYQHPLLNKETGVYSYDQAHRAEKDPDARRPAGGGLDHQPGRRAQDGLARTPGHHQQRCHGGREGIL